MQNFKLLAAHISIHAPSRERLLGAIVNVSVSDFNPRSLAGATDDAMAEIKSIDISIHAPSRERHAAQMQQTASRIFQSTLPRGSDQYYLY